MSGSSDPTFEAIFQITVGHEGGFTNNPQDAGNWTSGRVGDGQLKGTNWGISAASYPSLDIDNLTMDQAREIYFRDFYTKVGADRADPALALILFDAAVNNGPGNALRWLQGALGVTVDGILGPRTEAALRATRGAGTRGVLVDLHANRIDFMARLPTWGTFGRGWSRRLAGLPFQAAQLAAQTGTLAA